MRRFVARFAKDQTGATAIEYAVMVALLAVTMIAAVTALGTGLSTKFNNIGNSLK